MNNLIKDVQSDNGSKRSKVVRWEWLGDAGKWNKYSDENSEQLTAEFVGGKDEAVVNVAPGVKMKARFNMMTQSNMSTGWQRDLRCISSDHHYSPPAVWEWGGDTDEWKKWV